MLRTPCKNNVHPNGSLGRCGVPQFVFKKYLDFEKMHGEEHRMEGVKAKAMAYVEGRGG